MSGYQLSVNRDESIVLNTYQPKSVPMHCRQHLESFKERAETAGVDLRYPHWAYTLEVGSRMFQKFVQEGQITENYLSRIMAEVNPDIRVVYSKTEPKEEFGLPRIPLMKGE